MARGGARPGAGNPGYGLNKKVGELKGLLLVAVLEDCQQHPERKLFWAEKFVNRLMPQEHAGQDGTDLVIKFDSAFTK